MDASKNSYSEPILVDHGSVETLTLGLESAIDEPVGRFDPESV